MINFDTFALGEISLFNLWKLPDEHKNEKLFCSVVKMNLLKCELYFMIIEFVLSLPGDRGNKL